MYSPSNISPSINTLLAGFENVECADLNEDQLKLSIYFLFIKIKTIINYLFFYKLMISSFPVFQTPQETK